MILVTGASGFVGANLCQRLEALQLPYRAWVRSTEKAVLRGIPRERFWCGDLRRDFGDACAGVSAVVHLAGLVRALSRGALWAVNAEATAALVRAVEVRAPEARIVHVSSLAAAGPSADGSGTAAPPAAARPVSQYGRSKLAGEVHVAEFGGSWIVLRPSIVYGSWDRDVLTLFRMLQRGRSPVLGIGARYSLIHVDDLVDAILLALEAPVRAAFVPVAHPEPLSQEEWMAAIAAALERPARFLRLPRCFGVGAAWLGELGAQLLRRPALFGLDKWREARAGSWVADVEPARRDLGFEARIGHLEGMRRTLAWYREKGWI